MEGYTKEQLEEAKTAIISALNKCGKIDEKKLPKSQQTLLDRRIRALRLALVLIEQEAQKDSTDAARRLASFEAAFEEVSKSMTEIPRELKKLKAEGKEKTARYKELFGQKLINSQIIALFERHGIFN